MPNWCNNYLELEHEDPAMIERARKAFAEGKLLEEFCPVPSSLHVVAGRVGDDTDPKQIELETQEAANIATHGYANWYDYCVNEWGTKWDVGGEGDQASQDSPTDLRMNFDSAWAPPIAAMEKFQDLGFKVKLVYWESGMCFCVCLSVYYTAFWALSQVLQPGGYPLCSHPCPRRSSPRPLPACPCGGSR